ncbi:MAG: hypothetical protein V3U92_12990 [Cellulophaga sp.]
MKSLFSIIKSDYLQRTRSYDFLVTLCVTLAIAYTFVPEPNANYSTIRIGNYIGNYNSAWFGYVTAIMTSIFLSLVGFYLINSSIKTDIETKVGQIVAATSISNFKYLFSKVLSNFLVLVTIVSVVFAMSIVLFFLYNDGANFELLQFIKPYLLITIPAMFCIAVLAVIFEMFIGKYSVLQNVVFFFLFLSLMVFSPKNENQFSLDIFGSKIVMHHLEKTVKEITNSDKKQNLTIGYTVGGVEKSKEFEFNGINFSTSFILSRFLWILLGILCIGIISPLFHRFNTKERLSIKKHKVQIEAPSVLKEIQVLNLPIAKKNYSLFPLLKTELLLLFRKGKKWLWILNIIGMVLLAFLPLKTAHQIVLPVLWFLQISRLSDLVIKEMINKVHYFAFSSYKPIRRLLFSQVLSGIILLLLLALPLLIRFVITFQLLEVLSIILGSVFIVLLATSLGILSKRKKLFEVLFFMIAYANINRIAFLDYFGGFSPELLYVLKLSSLIVFLILSVFLTRNYQLKSN